MHDSAPLQCPYCGQIFDLFIDTSQHCSTFITDCEICCRPIEVAVQCDDGEVLDICVKSA